MSPFSRFAGRNRRGSGQPQPSQHAKTPRSPRTSKSEASAKDQQHKDKVDILMKNPELFAAFKKRVSDTNHFSNAGACFVLHDFLDEIDLPPTEAFEVIPSPVSRYGGGNAGGGSSYGFGLLSSLRTMAMDPQSPDISYGSSPRSRFSPCPESPQPNLSPTLTPITPISASSSSTMSPSSDIDSVATTTKPRSSHPACLEQPNF